MGNSRKKKSEALIHNASFDLAEGMAPVGACVCGRGTLFMYLKSDDANVFNVYCTNPRCGVTDIRKPNLGDVYAQGVHAVIEFLKESYGAEKIDALWDQEFSSIVDNVKEAAVVNMFANADPK
jgi:hypothetical protein